MFCEGDAEAWLAITVKKDLREAHDTRLFHYGHVVVSRRVERTREGEAGMVVLARRVKAGLN